MRPYGYPPWLGIKIRFQPPLPSKVHPVRHNSRMTFPHNATSFAPRLSALMARPVDGASMSAFRVVFGALGLITVVRFFVNGWIGPLYIEPEYHFAYLGFGWLQPWPGWGMYVHFAGLGLLALGMALGYRPRLCAALFCVGFTYVELLDRTTYLNHYYLMSLVALLLAVLPTHGGTGRFGWRSSVPLWAPLWALWTLRAQVGAVYAFAGIAKLNPDWLFHGLPLRIWLYQHGDLPGVGPLLQEVWVAYAMSWGGALFDLAVAPALVWQRTRPYAYAALVVFHLATWALFPQLGMFPWLMIGLTLIFFNPNWPRRLLRRPAWLPGPASSAAALKGWPLPGWQTGAVVVMLALFAAAQVVMPLRHWAYPGNVRWNEEGYRFAWRVMLTEKIGFVQYRVRDPVTARPGWWPRAITLARCKRSAWPFSRI